MTHLIRNVSGTNREPVYGLWHVCEICPDDPEIENERESLQNIVDKVIQVPGMTLKEFWESYVQEELVSQIHSE